MTPQEIKNALDKEDIKLAYIAKALEVSPSTVSSVVSGRHNVKKIALAICKLLNKTPKEVFPNKPQYQDDYDPSSKPEAKVKEIRQRLALAS